MGRKLEAQLELGRASDTSAIHPVLHSPHQTAHPRWPPHLICLSVHLLLGFWLCLTACVCCLSVFLCVSLCLSLCLWSACLSHLSVPLSVYRPCHSAFPVFSLSSLLSQHLVKNSTCPQPPDPLCLAVPLVFKFSGHRRLPWSLCLLMNSGQRESGWLSLVSAVAALGLGHPSGQGGAGHGARLVLREKGAEERSPVVSACTKTVVLTPQT